MTFKTISRVRTSVTATMALALLALLTGCDRSGESSGLPAIPAVDARGLEAPVEEQLREAHAALKEAPREAAANGEFAMTLHAYRHYEPADAVYRRARALDPDDFRWLYYHADVLRALGRQDDAVAALREGVSLRADEPWLRIRLAQQLISNQSLEQAATELEQAMRIDPANAEARYEYGVLMALLDKEDVAFAALSRAVDLAPDYAAAYYRLADIHRRRGEEALAESSLTLFRNFENSGRSDGDPWMAEITALDISEQSLLQQVRGYLARGDADRGIEVLEKIIERNPQSAAAHATLVGVLARRQQFDLADRHFELSYAIEPDNPQLFYNLGVARMTERRLGAAEDAFRTMVQLDPQNPLAYMMLGMVLERRNNRNEAVQQYAEALERNPNLGEVRLNLGVNLMRLSKPAAAAETLEQYRVVNDSASARALATLASAYIALERFDDAENTLARAVEVATAAGDEVQLRASREDLERLRRDLRE